MPLDIFVNAFTIAVTNPKLLMKNGFLLSCVLALAMLGGGFWLDKKSASKHDPALVTGNTMISSSRTETPALPPVKKSTGNNATAAATTDKLSLAEIEARIRTLNVNPGRFGDREIMKLLDSVDIAAFPKLLAFIDKNTPRNERQSLRYSHVRPAISPTAVIGWG